MIFVPDLVPKYLAVHEKDLTLLFFMQDAKYLAVHGMTEKDLLCDFCTKSAAKY